MPRRRLLRRAAPPRSRPSGADPANPRPVPGHRCLVGPLRASPVASLSACPRPRPAAPSRCSLRPEPSLLSVVAVGVPACVAPLSSCVPSPRQPFGLRHQLVGESLKIKFLSPYLESSGQDFTHGVNFAVAGSATETNGVPFPLSTQVNQFLHFKNKTRELRPQGKGSMITEEGFRNAVYSFDMGQNDISIAFTANLTYPQVLDKIPSILSRIKDSIKTVYDNGGRKFWLYNTQPIGCLPQTLALRKKNDSELDSFGCLAAYNNASRAFNVGFSDLCDELTSELKNATVVCSDKHAIRYDLVANHTKYGFEDPLMACCGHGGPPYNYKDRMTCGQPTATACPVGARYVSWDGVNNSEAANLIIATKILSAKYSRPRIKLKTLCKSEVIAS